MVLFKINGERNSGTNFLKNILIKNGFSVYEQRIEKNIVYHWKHGIPYSDVKLLDDKVVDIFIFRNLEGWLQSMYMNIYHLKNIKDFNDFLLNKQQSIEKKLLDYNTMKYLNEDDNDKTIFEIRYYKYRKILEYKKNNDFIIFVNLNFLQDKNNLSYFLKYLDSTYIGYTKKTKYIIEMPHTKDKSIKTSNRIYNIDIEKYKDIINKYKNEEIENIINNLTFDDKNSLINPLRIDL